MTRRKISSTIRDEISDLIGVEFMPGDKIPSENELCVRFDASRTTIREALRALRSMGILEVRQGIGTFVCENPGVVEDPFGWKFIDNDIFIPAMWETSMLLEPQLAAWTALRATETELEEIESINDELKANVEEYRRSGSLDAMNEVFRLDGEFHTAIAKYSGNVVFYNFYTSYVNIINSQLEPSSTLSAMDSIIKYHPLLLDAMKSRNDEKARQIMYNHDLEISKTNM
ncbi:MAG: FadR family transcriptional regulator [Eubacteriaceae bacterium]|nr:FadR family transcriptional regulator [Eubacteriaceae bacterium]